jgi:hypothetical protein
MVVEDDAPSVVILDHALRAGESSQLCERLKEQNIPYEFHRGYPNSGGATDYELSVSERAAVGLLVTVVEGCYAIAVHTDSLRSAGHSGSA